MQQQRWWFLHRRHLRICSRFSAIPSCMLMGKQLHGVLVLCRPPLDKGCYSPISCGRCYIHQSTVKQQHHTKFIQRFDLRKKTRFLSYFFVLHLTVLHT